MDSVHQSKVFSTGTFVMTSSKVVILHFKLVVPNNLLLILIIQIDNQIILHNSI